MGPSPGFFSAIEGLDATRVTVSRRDDVCQNLMIFEGPGYAPVDLSCESDTSAFVEFLHGSIGSYCNLKSTEKFGGLLAWYGC
jgi:hypothetical protein